MEGLLGSQMHPSAQQGALVSAQCFEARQYSRYSGLTDSCKTYGRSGTHASLCIPAKQNLWCTEGHIFLNGVVHFAEPTFNMFFGDGMIDQNTMDKCDRARVHFGLNLNTSIGNSRVEICNPSCPSFSLHRVPIKCVPMTNPKPRFGHVHMVNLGDPRGTI